MAFEAATIIDGHEWAGPGVHPGKVVSTLRALLPDDGIVTTDAGSFGTWAARGFRFRRPGTFLGSTSGAMGYGLPAAIAAGLVHRDRAVVAMVGDGGLGMTLAEIETRSAPVFAPSSWSSTTSATARSDLPGPPRRRECARDRPRTDRLRRRRAGARRPWRPGRG